jgi:asparagine synthase (glutamine-hydrolysing)
MARESGIKVMLDGQGADESLAGYKGYAAARVASLVRSWRWIMAGRFLIRASKWPGREGLWMEAGQYLLHPSLQNPLRRVVGRPLLPPWLNGEWFSARGVMPASLRGKDSNDALRHELHHTLTVTSLPMLLRYEDRDSMAHSVESRVPFLTPDLVNFILALPEEFILDDAGASKAILRRAMRGIVPDAILDRKDKIGFATSERLWLTHLRPWVEKTFRSHTASTLPALNRDAMESEWQAVLSDSRPFDFRIWRFLNLIRWADSFGVIFE